MPQYGKRAFTLIELLVVIAIIAILSVVVILTLNPASLLQQSRDTNRISDMATLNSALGLYASEGGASFGNANAVYVSVPDPSATSTLGDQCQGLGLPTLPASDTYQCASSSTFRNANGSGWIPVNFSVLPAGAPLAQLPTDPINTTSSGLYYTYATNGTQYEVNGIVESQKDKAQFATSPVVSDYPEVIGGGSNLSINPLWNQTGLVGYWPFTEGTGTVAYDSSGNGNNMSLTSFAWSSSGCKVGNACLGINGGTGYASTSNSLQSISTNNSLTVAFWLKPGGTDSGQRFASGNNWCASYGNWLFYAAGANNMTFVTTNNSGCSGQVGAGATITPNVWNFIVGTINQGTQLYLYLNGVQQGSGGLSISIASSATQILLQGSGNIDTFNDVRVYNRALSAAEIAALYNAEK